MSNELEQRRKGAEMIVERCKRLASELGVDLDGVEWKENIEDSRDVYTLVVHVGPSPDEVPLADTELQAYSTKTNTHGTDEKLKSIIKKGY